LKSGIALISPTSFSSPNVRAPNDSSPLSCFIAFCRHTRPICFTFFINSALLLFPTLLDSPIPRSQRVWSGSLFRFSLLSFFLAVTQRAPPQFPSVFFFPLCLLIEIRIALTIYAVLFSPPLFRVTISRMHFFPSFQSGMSDSFTFFPPPPFFFFYPSPAPFFRTSLPSENRSGVSFPSPRISLGIFISYHFFCRLFQGLLW